MLSKSALERIGVILGSSRFLSDSISSEARLRSTYSAASHCDRFVDVNETIRNVVTTSITAKNVYLLHV